MFMFSEFHCRSAEVFDMMQFKSLYCCLLLVVVSLVSAAKVRKSMAVSAYRNCSRHYDNYIRNVVIDLAPGETRNVQWELVINQPSLITQFEMEFRVSRCEDRSATECQFFQNFLIKDGCSFILGNDPFWSSAFNSTVPPLVCPLVKGVYTAKKSYISGQNVVELMKSINFPEEHYWIVKVLGKIDKKTIGCLEVVGYLYNMRT